MYFAKLVHSQTRRCIQNSVAPVVSMMNATSVQPATQNATPSVQQPTMEGYSYLPNANTPMMWPYQRYAPAANFEKEQYSRQQYFNMPSNETMEMPTLANFAKQNRSDDMNLRNGPHYEINETKYDDTLPHNKYNQNDMDFDHITNMNRNPTTTSSASYLLPVDKEPADFQDSEKLTTTTSSTFEEIPNVQMMSQMQINQNTEKRLNPKDSLNKNNQLPHNVNNKEINENVYSMKPQSSALIKSLPKTVTHVTQNNNQIRNNIEATTLNKTQVQDMITPSLVKPPPKSTEINEIKQTYEIPQNSTISTNNIKSDSIEVPNLPNAAVNNNSESNSSLTPVSIENIENAIYGELLSPLEAEQEQNQEQVSVVPTLLENLVTQSEPLDTQTNFSLEENAEIKLDTTSTTNNNNKTFKEFEENSNNETPVYEQDINTQQNEEPSVSNEADYSAYGNVDPNTINETQQEQPYDYSNYDPTQYSYPGYIYDEATGEYKPDPNAPPDQYAADQQYATEGYDQQYQQQNAYDYNQTYAQETPANIDNNAYNNYDTTLPLENATNITTTDSNLDQQQQQQQQQTQLQYSETEPQSQLEQPLEEVKENTSEEQPQTQVSAKVTKPTSILSTTEKNDNQKKKKRVNFVDSSEADESVTDKEVVLKTKPATGGSSESDFDFSSSVEGETKTT